MPAAPRQEAPLSRTVAPYASTSSPRQRQTASGPATPEIFIPVTNAIESINFQLRKITKNRGHCPDDDAAMKLLYHGVRNITGRHIDGDGLTLQRGGRAPAPSTGNARSTPSPSGSATGSRSNRHHSQLALNLAHAPADHGG